jgi:hypothetical protein
MSRIDELVPLTVEEMAEQLGADPQVIRDAARAGRVPGAFRIGHRWFFARPLIYALLREGRACTQEAADA